MLRDLQRVHDVDRTITDHLVGQRGTITVDVLRGRRVHVRQRSDVRPHSPRFEADPSVQLARPVVMLRRSSFLAGRSTLPRMQTLVLALIVVYAVFFALIYAIVVRRDS